MHSTDQHQRDAFQDRIARISQQRGTPEPTEIKQNYAANMAYPLSFIGAAAIGAFSVLLARYLRFHMGAGGIGGEGAESLLIMDVVMASAAGLFLKMIFRIQAQHYKTAQTVGVLAMVALMHNAVHFAPGVFSKVFSDDWVEEVLIVTDPKTAIFAGFSIPLGQDGQQGGGSGAGRSGDGLGKVVMQNGG